MPMTFDLDTIPRAEREPALRELLRQNPVPIDVSSGGPDKLHVSTIADFFGQLFMVSCNGHGALVHRGERRADEDHQRMMMLSVVTSGSTVFRHNNTVTDAGLGDVVPYSSTLPYSATFGGVSKHTFMVDWDALELPERTLDAQLGQCFNRGHVLGHIVSRYLTDLGSNAVYLPDEQRHALEQPTLDMLRALFAVTAGDDARARDPLGATLDIRVLHYIKMHVRDHDLTIERIAREHAISERYVYLILARQGITLGDWIRTQRLEGAAHDLTRAGNPAPSISEIARNWGFPDQGNFTRAFAATTARAPANTARPGRRKTTPKESRCAAADQRSRRTGRGRRVPAPSGSALADEAIGHARLPTSKHSQHGRRDVRRTCRGLRRAVGHLRRTTRTLSRA